ncbi:hypothetical protein [Dankookia sp. P2]|uniref:hypothetical protein n=1 Tax=Dankookia sp. P2 TaxID=3423955 RepID=UPI003D668816
MSPGLRATLLILILLPGLALGVLTTIQLRRGPDLEEAEAPPGLARRLATVVDRAVEARIAGLLALAASPQLDAGPDDLGGFALHAGRVAAALGSPIGLLDRDLRPVHGTTPPHQVPAAAATLAFATLRPAVAPGRDAQGRGPPALLVLVPVVRQGGADLLLATRLAPADLARILAAEALPAGTSAALVDEAGTAVARPAAPGGATEGALAAPDVPPAGQHRLGQPAGWAVTVAGPAGGPPRRPRASCSAGWRPAASSCSPRCGTGWSARSRPCAARPRGSPTRRPLARGRPRRPARSASPSWSSCAAAWRGPRRGCRRAPWRNAGPARHRPPVSGASAGWPRPATSRSGWPTRTARCWRRRAGAR